jgi:hypothetical protein
MAGNLILVEGDLASADRAVRHVFVGGRHFEGPKKKETKPGEAAPDAKGDAAKIDLTGSWKLTSSNKEHAFTSTLTLKQDGAKLTGKLVSEMGEAEITSGSLDGASFKLVIAANLQNQKFEFVLKGTASADLMTGTMETPFGEPVDIEAHRTPKGGAR